MKEDPTHMKARVRIRTGFLTILAASVVSVAGGSTAFALSLDFTDGSWNAAQGTSAFTTHPSNVGVFASGGTQTVNYVNGPSSDDTGMDGLGINDDEITQGGIETLTIAFAAPVTLESVRLTDLFLHEGPTGQSEVGMYSLNGGTFTSFSSVGAANGALTLNISQPGISSIVFKSANDNWSDYSVKGVTYQAASVPEPSSLLLLGSGLVGLVAWRRKRAA